MTTYYKAVYKAVYAGNGKCFNLVAIFYPGNYLLVQAVVNNLLENKWTVVVVDSDTVTPKKELSLV